MPFALPFTMTVMVVPLLEVSVTRSHEGMSGPLSEVWLVPPAVSAAVMAAESVPSLVEMVSEPADAPSPHVVLVTSLEPMFAMSTSSSSNWPRSSRVNTGVAVAAASAMVRCTRVSFMSPEATPVVPLCASGGGGSFSFVVTLASLLTPRTRVQWREILLTELSAAGFAVSLAPTNDNRRNVVEMVAAGLAKVDETVAKIAAGGLLDYATGAWLVLRARAGYSVEAKTATTTYGTVRLTCASTAGPYNLGVGTVWVGRAATGSVPARRFQNTSGGLLSSGSYLDVAVRAEFPGSAYNVGNGTLTTLFTSLPGVSVSNPALGLTSTWITTPGTDDEQDPALVQRCRDKWSTLGRLGNLDAYRYLCTSASPEIARVRIYPGPGDGTLEVILAGPTGIVSSNAVSLAQAKVAALGPETDAPTLRAATLSTITPTGTVYVRSASLTSAQAAADVARVVLLASLDIGEGVDLGAIYAALRQPGVTDVDLASPSGDTSVAYDRIAGLDFSSIVWVAV